MLAKAKVRVTCFGSDKNFKSVPLEAGSKRVAITIFWIND
jgi:hypothetical protein